MRVQHQLDVIDVERIVIDFFSQLNRKTTMASSTLTCELLSSFLALRAEESLFAHSPA